MTDLPIEDVQNYPRPPALEPVSQRIRVVLGGETIVDSTDAYRVLETHHAPTYYIPPSALTAQITPAPGRSLCEWKGQARYFDLSAGHVVAPRAAWSYARPTERFAPIQDYIAIYASSMDACFVGDTQVTPQDGDFYGGWVTPNLRGTVKGARGTEHW